MRRRFFLGLMATLPVAAPAAPVVKAVPHLTNEEARRQRQLGKIVNFAIAYGYGVQFLDVSWVAHPTDPHTRILQRTT